MKFNSILMSMYILSLSILISSCGTDDSGCPFCNNNDTYAMRNEECKLDCSDAVIANSNIKFEKLSQARLEQCNKSGVYEVKFKVIDSRNHNEDNSIPIISILPKLSGELDNSSSDIANKTKYPGIITPASEFCSDSCGYVSIKFRAKCNNPDKNSKASLVISSGAVISPSVDINF